MSDRSWVGVVVALSVGLACLIATELLIASITKTIYGVGGAIVGPLVGAYAYQGGGVKGRILIGVGVLVLAVIMVVVLFAMLSSSGVLD